VVALKAPGISKDEEINEVACHCEKAGYAGAAFDGNIK
jgi:hypothetical protein